MHSILTEPASAMSGLASEPLAALWSRSEKPEKIKQTLLPTYINQILGDDS